MALSLTDFTQSEADKLAQFATWYKRMNILYPGQYPLEMSDGNEGAWDEMLADFDPASPEYKQE